MTQNKHVIAALPLIANILGQKYGVRVFIGGDDAFTDGKDIHLPGLPLDADETLLHQVRGFIDHESAHLRETDFVLFRQSNLSPLEKHIFNIFEDWRVEHRLADVFPGCRSNFTWLIKHLFVKENSTDEAAIPAPQRNPAVQILNWLLFSVRAWDVPEVGKRRDAVSVEMDGYFPGLRTELESVMATVPARCDSTHDAIVLAREIVEILRQYVENQPEPDVEEDPVDGAIPSPGQQLRELLEAGVTGLPQGLGDLGSLLSELIKTSCQVGGTSINVAIPTRKTGSPLAPHERDAARTATTALRTRLQALMQSTVQRRTHPGRSGKLAPGRLHRLLTLDPRVFVRKGERQGIATAIHILLDCSGSMSGRPIQLAGQACFAVASALDSIQGINLAVTAFPGEQLRKAPSEDRSWQTVAPILKHGQKMHDRFVLSCNGCTPMAEAIWWALQQMQFLRENRKILLIISDGMPDSGMGARTAIEAARGNDVEVYGLGILNPDILHLLSHSSRNIEDITELAPAMFGLLQEALLSGVSGANHGNR